MNYTCVKLISYAGPTVCGTCSQLLDDYVLWEEHTEREANLIKNIHGRLLLAGDGDRTFLIDRLDELEAENVVLSAEVKKYTSTVQQAIHGLQDAGEHVPFVLLDLKDK